MALGELLEVTVHVDRALGLHSTKNLRAGTTVAELKAELARDDPTGSLQPGDFVLGCAGTTLSDSQRITKELLVLDLRQADAEEAAGCHGDGARWVRYQDPRGKAYYHDVASGHTQWEEPAHWREPEGLPASSVAATAAEAVATAAAPDAEEPEHGGACEQLPVAGGRGARRARATCAAPTAPTRPSGAALDEASVRKLFEAMDRGGNGQVSQRDVLVALKKQPPVRRLFGLPVTNVEPGGDSLEARLLSIQDSFEAGSGLGELAPVFEKLREAGGSCGQSFGWDAFLACCRTGSLRAGARAAAAVLPREHATGAAFVPTRAWQEVPEDAVCPGGLEYKMDMATGKTLARLPVAAKAAKAAA